MGNELRRAGCETTLLLLLAALLLHSAGANSTNCTPLPKLTPLMSMFWDHVKVPDPPASPILRGPNQTPALGYSTAYGSACPKSGRIDFPYWTENPTSPGTGGDFQFTISVLLPSSNTTLAPFSNDLMPVEQLEGPVAKPTVSETCDAKGRCIEAYELVAQILVKDLGFKDSDGKPLLSQFLAYNGSIPGPKFLATQGVQTLLRLHNHIGCNTTTMRPIQDNCSYYSVVDTLTLHHHGGSSLAPFDGWAGGYTPACSWKDYVYPNERGLQADWYHDHSVEITSITAGSGMLGTFWVTPCDVREVPAQLLALAPDANPQYLTMYDAVFWQLPGSSYMNPYMANTQSVFPAPPGEVNADAVAADHIFVNGLPWPQVSVQRRPYWFVLHNAAQSRTFNLLIMNARTNATLPVWFVGSDSGLRNSPWFQKTSFIMGSGERYHVVIDFSSASPGDEFIINNLPTPEANFAQYCYTNLVMKFVVNGIDQPSPAFDSNYTVQGRFAASQAEISAACTKAQQQGADVQMVAATQMTTPKGTLAAAWGFQSTHWNSSNITAGQWGLAMMSSNLNSGFEGAPGSNMMRRSRLLRGGATGVSGAVAAMAKELQHSRPSMRLQRVHAPAAGSKKPQPSHRLLQENITNVTSPPFALLSTLPMSMVQNMWMTWSITNQGGGTHPHPMHLHLMDFYVCANSSAQYYRGYEVETPKDTVFLDSDNTITLAARFGPHQGSFTFHCHNLYHEDNGLMGMMNVTSYTRPAIHTMFPNTTAGAYSEGSKVNYGMGKDANDKYAARYPYSDPLVMSVPEYPAVGHELYYSSAMPSWAHRTDPKHPGRPQPLTKNLLKKVLKRNYYGIFYPKSRSSLSEPVPDNEWAVVCPAPATK